MRIHIGTDHAGFELKNKLLKILTEQGHELIDHGPQNYQKDDDYPYFCIATAQAVAQDQKKGEHVLGIVLGGSGNGEQIAANKVKGIRAALVTNEDTAKLARQHNDANIISLGARQLSEQEIISLVQIFLEEPFTEELRHIRRIKQVSEYEGSCYPLKK